MYGTLDSNGFSYEGNNKFRLIEASMKFVCFGNA